MGNTPIDLNNEQWTMVALVFKIHFFENIATEKHISYKTFAFCIFQIIIVSGRNWVNGQSILFVFFHFIHNLLKNDKPFFIIIKHII